ncbi:MAG TPA: hypothetical protein VH916_11885 [Dehalococcoidia bacterium]
MVRKVYWTGGLRTALLVATLAAVAVALGAIHVGHVNAQTPPMCLTNPATGTVSCVDQFGNPITTAATTVTPTPAAVALPQVTANCFVDQFGGLVCPSASSIGTIAQLLPLVVNPLQPQPLVVQPQISPLQFLPLAVASQSCFVTDLGTISCI